MENTQFFTCSQSHLDLHHLHIKAQLIHQTVNMEIAVASSSRAQMGKSALVSGKPRGIRIINHTLLIAKSNKSNNV